MSISEKELRDLEIRQKNREGTLKLLRIKKDRQKNCSHLLGSTGVSLQPPPGWKVTKPIGAFCGQKLATGELIGVCLYCQKEISSKNLEDSRYFLDPDVQWFNLNRNAEAWSSPYSEINILPCEDGSKNIFECLETDELMKILEQLKP